MLHWKTELKSKLLLNLHSSNGLSRVNRQLFTACFCSPQSDQLSWVMMGLRPLWSSCINAWWNTQTHRSTPSSPFGILTYQESIFSSESNILHTHYLLTHRLSLSLPHSHTHTHTHARIHMWTVRYRSSQTFVAKSRPDEAAMRYCWNTCSHTHTHTHTHRHTHTHHSEAVARASSKSSNHSFIFLLVCCNPRPSFMRTRTVT